MIGNSTGCLPDGFSDLENLIDEGWCFGLWSERNARRYRSTLEALDTFYEQVFPRSEKVLEYLSMVSIDEMQEKDEKLLQIMLMLVEASFPVERHRQPNTPEGIATERLQPWDAGPEDSAA